jgi:DNA polymerase-3 subunit delta'
MDVLDARDLFWLEEQRQALSKARANQRFPHAILIHAPSGCGGEALCRFAAQALLCKRSPAPCGQCRDCQLATRVSHPDFHWVGVEEKKSYIAIDQIRELTTRLTLTSYESGGAVAVIAPADRMQAASSNALLKTLEEPRPGVTIVLLTAWPGRLLPTIVSRCLLLRVAVPPRAASLAWLQSRSASRDWSAALAMCGDAPLAALENDAAALAAISSDTFRAMDALVSGALTPPGPAAEWSRVEQYRWRMAGIENWITSRIEAELAIPQPSHLPAAAAAQKIAWCSRLLESTYELMRHSDSPLNKSLGLERLFWQASRMNQTGPQ